MHKRIRMSATKEDKPEIAKALEQHCQTQLEKETELSLLILGEPGIGKSTLINGLLGAAVAETSAPGFLATAGITTEVKIYQYKQNNANIKIWDTPGLLDPTCDSDKVLEKVKEKLSEIDLFLFGIRMDQPRYLPENITQRIITKLSQKIGNDMWKKTLVVLTRANVAVSTLAFTTPTENLKPSFETLLAGYKTEVTKDIKEYSKDALTFAVAGIESQDKLFPDDTECWLSTFWEKCFECTDSIPGKISLVKVNKDRLEMGENTQEAQKPGQTKKLQHQKIKLSKDFKDRHDKSILSSLAKGTVVGGTVGGAAGAAGAAGTAVGVAASTAGGALTTAAATAAVTAVAVNPVFWAILGASAVGGGLIGLAYSYGKSSSNKKK